MSYSRALHILFLCRVRWLLCFTSSWHFNQLRVFFTQNVAEWVQVCLSGEYRHDDTAMSQRCCFHFTWMSHWFETFQFIRSTVHFSLALIMFCLYNTFLCRIPFISWDLASLFWFCNVVGHSARMKRGGVTMILIYHWLDNLLNYFNDPLWRAPHFFFVI